MRRKRNHRLVGINKSIVTRLPERFASFIAVPPSSYFEALPVNAA